MLLRLSTVSVLSVTVLALGRWRRGSEAVDEDEDEDAHQAAPASQSTKAEKHMAEWMRLNAQSPGAMTMPPFTGTPSLAHAEVCAAVTQRLACHGARAGSRDWLVRASHYAHGRSSHPHAAVKREVNAALAHAVRDTFGPNLAARLRASPAEVLLVLDAPSFGRCRALVAQCGAGLLHCPQLVVPQSNLGQYFAMISPRADVYVACEPSTSPKGVAQVVRYAIPRNTCCSQFDSNT